MVIRVIESLVRVLFILNLILIAIWDLKYLKIPDKLLGSLLVLSTIISILKGTILVNMYSSFLVFLIMTIFSLTTKLGGGDIKLISIIGMTFGPKTILAIFMVSNILSGLIGLVLIIFKKAKFDTKIPLGPSIVLVSLLLLIK
jgi:Flp pilus assembly protein protease CpaA